MSSSVVERQYWTVRTNAQRDTDLSDGFSGRIENHTAGVGLNDDVAYHFIWIRRRRTMTPARGAGVKTGSGRLRISCAARTIRVKWLRDEQPTT
jgi:hypothetical protein